MWKAAIYFIIINTMSLTMMYMDKYYAKTSKRRIRESRLISTALLGGSLGAFIGMKLFRHKTKHSKFKYGLPLMMALQFAVFIAFLLQSKGYSILDLFKVV
jgi:uncharacterized protein